MIFKSTHFVVGALVAAAFAAGTVFAQGAAKPGPTDVMTIELKTGKVIVQLRPDLAPKHVARVKQLVAEKFYDGIKFHRVIPGFMAQSGDPTGTGTGGSKYPDLNSEFTQTPYVRGTIGAARTQNPDTANSQFYICFTDTGCSFLRGQYTVWGQVIAGMEHVDKIATGEPPAKPDTMLKVTMGDGR